MKKVIIVRLEPLAGVYKDTVAILEQIMSMWAASVTTLAWGEAWGAAGRGEADCVVFISVSQVKMAKKFKSAIPRLKVVIVLDNVTPDNESVDGIILLDKNESTTENLRKIVLDG